MGSTDFLMLSQMLIYPLPLVIYSALEKRFYCFSSR
jgi:hypothetical protein